MTTDTTTAFETWVQDNGPIDPAMETLLRKAWDAGMAQGYLPCGRVRHLKRDKPYDVLLRNASVQTSRPIVEGDVLAVYVGKDGDAWARLEEEFVDGRFEDLQPGVQS